MIPDGMTATLSAFGPKETMARLHEAVIAHDGKEVLPASIAPPRRRDAAAHGGHHLRQSARRHLRRTRRDLRYRIVGNITGRLAPQARRLTP
jgi:hypothetical protein